MASRINRFKGLLFKTISILIVVIGLSSHSGYGQEDTVKNFKNTIKFNISNPVLFNWEFNIIGYERVINNYQTASLSIGRTHLGGFSFLSDSLGLKDQFNDKGFNFSLEYRFYLHKENKYHAPRGVYIGPYYGLNTFSRDLLWDLNTSTYSGQITTGYKITANLIGFQLGYQFIFRERLSLDLVLMGPGLWNFNFKSNFSTNLLPEDEALLLGKLNELLKEKLPGTDFVFSGNGIEANKTYSTSMMGFRYMVNIGFRF